KQRGQNSARFIPLLSLPALWLLHSERRLFRRNSSPVWLTFETSAATKQPMGVSSREMFCSDQGSSRELPRKTRKSSNRCIFATKSISERIPSGRSLPAAGVAILQR